jgi:hypothetical protein
MTRRVPLLALPGLVQQCLVCKWDRNLHAVASRGVVRFRLNRSSLRGCARAASEFGTGRIRKMSSYPRPHVHSLPSARSTHSRDQWSRPQSVGRTARWRCLAALRGMIVAPGAAIRNKGVLDEFPATPVLRRTASHGPGLSVPPCRKLLSGSRANPAVRRSHGAPNPQRVCSPTSPSLRIFRDGGKIARRRHALCKFPELEKATHSLLNLEVCHGSRKVRPMHRSVCPVRPSV